MAGLIGNVLFRAIPVSDAGVVKSVMSALPGWRGGCCKPAPSKAGRIATNRHWLIASELAFGDRPWFAAPTIDRRCAIAGKAVCKTSGFLCSFCAGPFMRSQRGVRFDTGSGHLRAHTDPGRPSCPSSSVSDGSDLACRTGSGFRRRQQERSLSDRAARPRKCCARHRQRCCRHCPGPLGLLEARRRRKIARAAVVSAPAGDAVGARCRSNGASAPFCKPRPRQRTFWGSTSSSAIRHFRKLRRWPKKA